MTAHTRNPALLAALLVGLFLTGCKNAPPPPPTPPAVPPAESAAASQDELLALGFEVASAIPLDPHIKDQARAQEAVVTACLQRDRAEQACQYAARIKNWRKGTAEARIAQYYARHGKAALADNYMKMAAETAANYAGWRKDRTLVINARTNALLGRTTQATELVQGVEDSEAGKLAGAVRPASQEAFNKKIQSLKDLVAKNNFDLTHNVLASAVELYGSEFDNAERRASLESFCRESWKQMPVFVRIQLISRMTEAAIDHGQSDVAVRLANEAQSLADGANWELRFGIPLMARLARLRYLSGDRDNARAALDALYGEYQERREQIVNIDRAGVLCPIAEAYQVMGDPKTAMDVYRLAVREAFVNPNARPRANDLSAICCSITVAGVTPDKELWAQLRKARKELGTPW